MIENDSDIFNDRSRRGVTPHPVDPVQPRYSLSFELEFRPPPNAVPAVAVSIYIYLHSIYI